MRSSNDCSSIGNLDDPSVDSTGTKVWIANVRKGEVIVRIPNVICCRYCNRNSIAKIYTCRSVIGKILKII